MIAYAIKTKQFIFKMAISFDGFKATVAKGIRSIWGFQTGISERPKVMQEQECQQLISKITTQRTGTLQQITSKFN